MEEGEGRKNERGEVGWEEGVRGEGKGEGRREREKRTVKEGEVGRIGSAGKMIL